MEGPKTRKNEKKSFDFGSNMFNFNHIHLYTLANLQPALEEGCGKQTPSAQKLFFRVNLLYVPYVKNVEETEIQVCAQLRYLRKESRCAMATSEQKHVSPAGKIGIRHCAAALFSQVPKLCTDLDLSLFYIWLLGACSKFDQKNNFLALDVCFPQPSSSAGRRYAVSRSRLQNYRRIVSFPQQKNR